MTTRTKRKKTAARRRPSIPSRAAVRESHHYLVGIGASAGGLEALKAFFSAIPRDIGVAFIVVVHLDPTHESLMVDLLSHATRLKVAQAKDRQLIEANHIYVIPPKCTLTIEQDTIRVQEVEDRRGLRGVIDHFLRSLAQAHGEASVAIILSGTGTEGLLGARAIKAQGGLVMAQTPETAAQAGMPGNVISAGMADVVGSPGKLAETLKLHLRNASSRAKSASTQENPTAGLPAILGLLRARTRYDFRGYKKGTMQRRIERRMGLQQVASLEEYVEYLRAHPTEVDQLFRDMLIGVTSFFRDPEAFQELSEKVLAALVRERDPDIPIRVWVPGCSTGEEAYSIAIALAEQLAEARTASRVQVFATDLDEEALDVARTGAYPESISIDVTPQRLRRFFTHEDHRYLIAKPIREMVIFAVQNLIGDPPFSRLDVVSCRNVLIYLEPDMQQKLLSVFHFSLNPGGYLFLGSAEGVGAFGELFSPVSKTRRIFRRLGPISRIPLELPGLPKVAIETAAAGEPSVVLLADQELLQHFSPPAVVVRSNGHILRFYGALDRYIRLPSGEATFDVMALARDSLKHTLRATLAEAVRRNRQTTVETLDVVRGRERTTLRITVKPLDGPKTAERCWLILFEEIASAPRAKAGPKGGRQPDLVRRLELELRATKKEQQNLIEQLESSNEELKAANEEVLSMNEELQSTNEEITTSKEELQSMNEELSTLNSQLQDKVHELTAVNDDLANLLVSTDIVTLFVDPELRIKRFTTAASQVLNLRPTDIARPMNHIAPNLIGVDIAADARKILRTLEPIEKEVAAQDGRHYFLRGLPYRTAEKQVEGVVITLVDITTLKLTEHDLREAREHVAEELRRMTRIHLLANKVAAVGESHGLLDEILRATLEITEAQLGLIQVCDASGGLYIAAHAGFEQPFLDHFARVEATASDRRMLAEDVSDSPIYADKASLTVVRAAGVRSAQSTPLLNRAGRLVGMFSTFYRTPHRFEADELRWLDLLARHVSDVLERQHADERLKQSHDELEQRVADRTQWLRLMHDVSRQINEAASWDDALRGVLRRICEVERWQLGYIYLPDRSAPEAVSAAIGYVVDPRLAPFHAAALRQRYSKGQTLPGRVFAEGVPVWVNDAEELYAHMPSRGQHARQVGLRSGMAMPILLNREVVAVLELLSDQHHAHSEQLDMLMRDIVEQIARVLERERSTARAAELLWREQQDLLHTLHDALGQTLTGLGMLSSGLRERLASGDPEAARTAGEIAQQAKEALGQVRTLTKGMFPVEIQAGTLMAALRDLAAATESLHRVEVRVEGQFPESMRDGAVANQLFRIAQEAVTNAVKHAQPHSITIGAAGDDTFIQLQVTDDGVGIAQPTPANGMGLKIMRSRASSIGGKLTVERRAVGGTLLTCTLRPAVSFT